jgi:hypothetical protein
VDTIVAFREAQNCDYGTEYQEDRWTAEKWHSFSRESCRIKALMTGLRAFAPSCEWDKTFTV